MKKTLIILTVAATVGLGTTFGGISVKTEASTISSLKGEQNKINGERSDLKSDINQANEKISILQDKQADVKSELKRLDIAIGDMTTKISDKTTNIETTKAQIQELQKETKIIMERIEKRNVLLKDRARTYQENGGVVNYLDVLMGATSFSDFVDRANAVATIVQADQEILKKQEADKKELEEKQNQVEQDLASLEKMLADLKNMNQQLSAQKAEKDKILGSLKDQEAEESSYVLDMSEQEKILAAQEVAVQKSIIQAEASAKAAAEAARAAARAEAEAKAKAPTQAKPNNSSNGGSGGTTASPAPAVSGGNFTRPASGYISSGFGDRSGGFHYGVDIAKSGSVPVVAAADGQVYVSHYSSSYGNVVYILHNVNGQMYTTVYAHLQSSSVGEGATVTKGQQIGLMGNTGDSHGQHLHFELYRGLWAYHQAISPFGIVPL